MAQASRPKGPPADEYIETTPASSSSSDVGFEDEIVLVPTSSLSSTRHHIPLTTPAALRPFSSPSPWKDTSAVHKPVEGVFATHRRWTSGARDRNGEALSDKARGKLPALTVETVTNADRRRKSLAAIASGGTAEELASRKSRLHMRWTSGESEADVTLERFATSSTSGTSTGPNIDGGDSEPAEQLLSPSPSTSLQLSPSTSSTASTRTKHSFELVIDQPLRPRAPPRPVPKTLPFPDKPAAHPLNRLRIRSHPADSPPPPPLAVRFVRNPHFVPARELGWIEGRGPHVEVKKRTGPIERAVAALPASREPTPLTAAEETPEPTAAGGRRSSRVPVQARPPSMVYPSAAERLASSTKPSRSSSSQLPTPPPSTSVPLSTAGSALHPTGVTAKPARRQPLSTVLRKRYEWLHPRSRGPFRIDGSAVGTDPTMLGFEWDEDELDEERDWERWKDGAESDDGDEDVDVKTGRYGGPWRVAQAAEAARRALRSSSPSVPPSSPGKFAVDYEPWTVVPWAWKDLDAAKGRAGPRGTAGWATRDPWMHYVVDAADSDGAASSASEAMRSPAAHQSPRRPLAVVESASSSLSPPAQVGAKITAVPPPSSPPGATRTVGQTPSEDEAVISRFRQREGAEPAGTLTSPIVFESTPASSTSSSQVSSPVLAATSGRRPPDSRTDSSPDPLDQLSGFSAHSSGASASASLARQQMTTSTSSTITSTSSGGASSSSKSPESVAAASRSQKRALGRQIPSTSASPASTSSTTPSTASASGSSTLPDTQPVTPPSNSRKRPLSARVSSNVASSASSSTSASAPTSSTSPPPSRKAAPAAEKKRKVEVKPVATPKKRTALPLVPKQANLKRPSASPERSAAALKRRRKEPTPEGFARCAHPDCPSPFYQKKAASSAGNHAQNYHGATVSISWRNPDRSAQLARSKKTGAFECGYCAFWSMNAASTKQHTYVRKGRVCPGPPVAAR